MSLVCRWQAALLALACLAAAPAARAELPVKLDASGRYVYRQDFNTLGAVSRAYDWVDNQTLPGWSLLNFVEQPLVTPTYRGDVGDDGSGSFYSYGLEGDANRALGALGSGSAYFGTPAPGALAGYITVAFRNLSGQDLDRIAVRFQGQQWRQGASDNLNTLAFEYGVGEVFGHVNWVRPGKGFDFDSPSPLIGTPEGQVVNGRDPLASAQLGGALPTVWPAGAKLWLRWVVVNNHGFDHGLAIDDVELKAERAPR